MPSTCNYERLDAWNDLVSFLVVSFRKGPNNSQNDIWTDNSLTMNQSKHQKRVIHNINNKGYSNAIQALICLASITSIPYQFCVIPMASQSQTWGFVWYIVLAFSFQLKMLNLPRVLLTRCFWVLYRTRKQSALLWEEHYCSAIKREISTNFEKNPRW